MFISGSLLNQIIPSNYIASKLKIPYLGIYSACASSAEGIILGASLIDGGKIKRGLMPRLFDFSKNFCYNIYRK